MSLSITNVGGTLTGGSTVVLQLSEMAANKMTFTTPAHTRLKPRTVDLYVTQARTTASDPGVAKAAFKVSFGDRVENAASCCTVQTGSVILDTSMRWHLNQPDTLVGEAWDILVALVSTPGVKEMLLKGVYPSS